MWIVEFNCGFKMTFVKESDTWKMSEIYDIFPSKDFVDQLKHYIWNQFESFEINMPVFPYNTDNYII